MPGANRAARSRIVGRSLATLLALLPTLVMAGTWRGGGRLEGFLARDDNVYEDTDAARRQTADSYRLLGEALLQASELPLSSHAEFSLRGLAESFRDHPQEDRRQGEAGLAWDLASATGRQAPLRGSWVWTARLPRLLEPPA